MIFTIFNQKGGVGKTTISVNLSHGVSLKKKKTLLIDLDPQANATSGLGFDKNDQERASYHLFSDTDPSELIKNHSKYLDVITSNKELAGFQVEIINNENWQSLLKDKLDKIKQNYDYIFIDSPPSLGELSINALTASDGVIIPVQCEYYALEGLSDLIDTIDRIKAHCNHDLEIAAVILNMYDKRNNLTTDVENEVRSHFKDVVLNSYIPRNIRLAEAPSYGESIYDYSSLSKGAWAFRALVNEFIKRSSQ